MVLLRGHYFKCHVPIYYKGHSVNLILSLVPINITVGFKSLLVSFGQY